MGEVYRAKDGKLKRDVALKVLPDVFANDPERMARFQREAEVLASLNHPHIAQIYSVEERALVMELVEGETLQGPLPVETALNYARQIAEALEAAHEKGIVHRDLKPANVMVTSTGVVKVLDFGLAAVALAPGSNPANSPTLTMSPTMAGVILGTAGYMSPEQARGQVVDKRADIWAFGVVLFELVTGRRLFEGPTVSDTLASVLKEEPDWNRAPTQLRRLLQSCLEKDPRRRLRDIGDVWRLLEDPAQTTSPRHEHGSSKLPWAVAAAATVAALGLGFVHYRSPSEEPRVLKYTVPFPEKASATALNMIPVVSPDGKHLAFLASVGGKIGLWVRDLDSLSARLLPGTETASRYPFWSPDSRFIAFFAEGKLKKITVAGGPALSLCDVGAGAGGSWSKNGVIVFANASSGLFRVPAAGGNVTPLTTLDPALGEESHRFPWFLPDGNHFLYVARNSDVEKTAVYVADLNSRTRRLVLAANSNAVYSPPGRLLFVRDRTLMAQPFDADKLETTGEPVPIAEQIDYISAIARGYFSASQNGVLSYSSGGSGADSQLTWFDRSGKPTGTVGAPGVLQWAAISPDGNAVATDRLDSTSGYYDIWLHDLARGTASRFTFNSKMNQFPVWSPDGSHIAYLSERNGVYQKATAGSVQDEVLDKAAPAKRAEDWSRDGRYMILGTPSGGKTSNDIWVLPLFGDRKPFPYLQTEFNERSAKLSPNGQWLAYASNETKRYEIYVQTFPSLGGKWQVSTSGGTLPVWSRDGKELFFIGADQQLMTVEVKGGAKFEASVPKPLFDTHLAASNAGYDVGKDGRFLMPVTMEQATNPPMTVVINWNAGMKRP